MQINFTRFGQLMQNPQIFVHTHGTAGFYKRISGLHRYICFCFHLEYKSTYTNWNEKVIPNNLIISYLFAIIMVCMDGVNHTLMMWSHVSLNIWNYCIAWTTSMTFICMFRYFAKLFKSLATKFTLEYYWFCHVK